MICIVPVGMSSTVYFTCATCSPSFSNSTYTHTRHHRQKTANFG